MTAQLPTSYRGGALSEYLAQYFLSNLGVSVQVLRQDDHGYDFICTLGFPVSGKQLMRFGHSCLVQVKASDDVLIEFGGINKKGEWLKHELDWLFDLDLPFVIGIANKKDHSLSLYSTSIMWILRYQKGNVGKVRFILNEQVAENGYRETSEPIFNAEGTDGKTYEVCLGKPLVRLDTTMLDQKLNLLDLTLLLNRSLDLELSNIAYRKMGVHCSFWLYDYTTNGPFSTAKVGAAYSWNSGPDANVGEQLQSAVPILFTLVSNFEAQQNAEALANLVGLYNVIKKYCSIPKWTDDQLKKKLGIN